MVKIIFQKNTTFIWFCKVIELFYFQLSLREWDIPYDALQMHEVIGTGRFGTVYRGQWHGDVAVKLLNMNYLQDEKTLEQFKNEVSIFRKTRHENVILFMGACMKPPRLAIVTSLSKGLTLYTHIHLRKDKFNMNKTTNIAQQICQVRKSTITKQISKYFDLYPCELYSS